jgi:hypothetical protein
VAAAFAFMMSPREPSERERACHYTGRPDLYTLNLRVGARVRILLVLVRVSGAKRPSFVLLSPSVHAATVNRYTAACMESKEDEEAWRSAREREKERPTHSLLGCRRESFARSPTRLCIINNQQLHHNAHNAPYIFPPGCFLAHYLQRRDARTLCLFASN